MFDDYEKKILNVLYAAGRPLTTKEISVKSKVTWSITKDRLLKLHRHKHIGRKEYENRIYWWLA